MGICNIEHCKETVESKGFCKKHYYSLWKYGDPLHVEKNGRSKNVKNKPLPYEHTHKIINSIEHKLCRICNNWHPMNEEYFYKKQTKDGFDSYCKECLKKKSDKWRRDNPEKHDISHRKYRKTSKNYRKYVRRNFEHQRDSGYSRNWRQENKTLTAEYNRRYQSNKKHDISKDELKKLYEYANSSCMYCGMSEEDHYKKYNQRLHRDHAINKGSNGIDNCVLACLGCNVAKYNRDWDEWYSPDNDKYDDDRFQMIVDWFDGFNKLNKLKGEWLT